MSHTSKSRVNSVTDTLPLSHALFVLGLLMINYGLQTPSLNGVSIAILGSMIGLPAMFAVYLCSLPEVDRGEEGQSNILIGRQSQEF